MLDKLKTWMGSWMNTPITRKNLVYTCLLAAAAVAAHVLLV